MAALTKEFLDQDRRRRDEPRKPRKSLEELTAKYYGEKGTPERQQFEFDLSLEMLSEKIKEMRKAKHLTQEQLGDIIGVQKAQISKLEKGSRNVTIETITKVFKALQANVKLKVEIAPVEELAIHI
ncbi:XRE family transcriptional regulator [Rufibacter immobilis]|uniref:XRE family transcriptional regulator n=1 Tax=Rufibacter immobilis TaxID=1348778 RepID=A0A3M9MR22_9BACT|nr:helix-turn-helix transcriptional regulator [Rufibacter immobilis]RNI27657.1 XRE family transcriptional regulator [Rufibacter immobilis]